MSPEEESCDEETHPPPPAPTAAATASRRSVVVGFPAVVAGASLPLGGSSRRIGAGRSAPASLLGPRQVAIGPFEVTITTLTITEPPGGSLIERHGMVAPQMRGDRFPAVRDVERARQTLLYDPITNTGRLYAQDESDRQLVALPGWVPLPSEQEWDHAVRILRTWDPAITAAAIRQPMPPFVLRERAGGGAHRLISVGVRRGGAETEYKVYLIDIVEERVTPAGLGETVLPSPESCGVPDLEGCRKVLPEYDAWAVKVHRQGALLWEMDVLRARASSGLNKSGIEVRRVRFRGKPVLSHGHVPILNVEYQQNDRGCGPSYRDWFGDEACFQASGTDFIGGLRICDKPPVTIVDSDSSDADEGSFRGIAIHATDDELVFTSETKAAWYRYVSQWRFADHGAIRPRLSFGATDNPCTCLAHTHHAYWRFDFSWENAAIRVIEKNPAMPRPRTVVRESRLSPRSPGYTLRLAGLGAGPWKLVPGPHDGTASPYGKADGWLLRSHPLEIDDLQGFEMKPEATAANLDRYLTGEKTSLSPVTLWYGAHHEHDCGCTSVGEPLGPDLLPDH